MNTILYRYFDSKDQLLYVGITGHQLKRQSQHRRSSKWFDQIASAKFQHFASRAEASAAEVRAIQEEKPLFNHQHVKNAKDPTDWLDFAARLHLLGTLNGTDMQAKPQIIDAKHEKYQKALQSFDFNQFGLSFDENLVLGLLEIWTDLYLTAPNFEDCDLCQRIFDTEWFNETFSRAENQIQELGDYELNEKGEWQLCL